MWGSVLSRPLRILNDKGYNDCAHPLPTKVGLMGLIWKRDKGDTRTTEEVARAVEKDIAKKFKKCTLFCGDVDCTRRNGGCKNPEDNG